MPRIRPFFADGWLNSAVHQSSPHFNERPQGTLISLVVLHYISLPAGEFGGSAVDDLFMGRLLETEDPKLAELRGLRVSSHFFIRRTGEVRQYVSVFDRAWHAGVSRFEGRENCNDFSVGIEIEGTGSVPFTETQYRALSPLLGALRRTLPIEAVTGHEFIAPGRKEDPGPYFNWWRVKSMLPSGVRVVNDPQRAL